MGTMLFRMDQPVELVREIVYNLPEELFQSDSTTFLDPAMGKGDYLVGIAQRLKEYGHSKENILSRLYGFECNAMYVQNCLHRTPLAGANITIKTYEEVLEWTPDMSKKFDVCIMNPPYNNSSSTENMTGNRRSSSSKLHVDFVEKALSIASTTVVICPLQGWWLGKGSKAKASILANKQLCSIDFIPANSADRAFNATVGNVGILLLASAGVLTTHVYYDGRPVGSVDAGADPKLVESTEVADMLTTLSAYPSIAHRVVVTQGPNRTQAENLPVGPCEYVPIIGATTTPLHVMLVDATITDPVGPLYQHRDYKINPNLDTYRIGINYAGTPHKLSAMKIIPRGVVVSRNVTTITAGSAVQAQNLIEYLHTTFVRAIIHMSHTGKNNTKQTFRYIPDIDLSRSWTDAELYKHFNLTQEEIDLIESTVK